MSLTIAVFVYAAAMTLANLSIATWGPWVSPVNAFVLIGLDLALRDWLHVRLRAWQMGALIACTGLLTYALNPAAGMIAVASACAFSAAALVDWFAPMSYGRGNEPAPEQLLMRGRATLFDSEREAMDALQVSLLSAKESGGTWMGKHNYSVVECSTKLQHNAGDKQ